MQTGIYTTLQHFWLLFLVKEKRRPRRRGEKGISVTISSLGGVLKDDPVGSIYYRKKHFGTARRHVYGLKSVYSVHFTTYAQASTSKAKSL